MSYVVSLLNEMRGRPLAIYVGSTSLTKLADFLRGYEHAVERLDSARPDPFLGEFRDWIHRRFQTTKHTWENTILQNSANDVDAVKRFWELLDEFLKERTDIAPFRNGYGERNDPPAGGPPTVPARDRAAG